MGGSAPIGLVLMRHIPRWRWLCLDPPGLKAMYVDCGGFSNAYQGGELGRAAPSSWKPRSPGPTTWGSESPERCGKTRDALSVRYARSIPESLGLRSMPWKRGHTPISLDSGLRELCLRPTMGARKLLRRLLEAIGYLRRGLLLPVRGRPRWCISPAWYDRLLPHGHR